MEYIRIDVAGLGVTIAVGRQEVLSALIPLSTVR